MGKENCTRIEKFDNIPSRTTRSRAKATELMGGAVNSKPFLECDQKRVLKACTKRPATNEITAAVTVTTRLQHKRRVVLGDVSNVSMNAETKIFKSKVKPIKETKGLPQNIKVIEDAATAEESQDLLNTREVSCKKASELPVGRAKGKPARHRSWTKKGSYVHEAAQSVKDESIADIDSNKRDPQMCSLYASDIYYTLRAAELNLRPSSDFMETVQRGINPSMRGILIDWLIEVSEEYKLVPDSLYLTVNLIDRFLSNNPVEKQRLQLLGVTCMLIASKYEEIFAPRVEEFCFITDNSYNKEEVLRMEIQVLDFLRFRLSVPTTKTFLRRFVRASQASSQAPSIELEFLSNYLAELTLLEYKFLKFLPSIIAASALFLAKWTMNQSEYPWNAALEHYTSYASSELKPIVLTMQDLQLNTTGCSLNAVREKYRQEKYKCVATLSSSKHVQILF